MQCIFKQNLLFFIFYILKIWSFCENIEYLKKNVLNSKHYFFQLLCQSVSIIKKISNLSYGVLLALSVKHFPISITEPIKISNTRFVNPYFN